MARKDRRGNRKPREQRKPFKTPKLGYYIIVTDTEATERCYFTGLRSSFPDDMKDNLIIKVVETETKSMIDKCIELTAYEAQPRIPWIVFDRDQISDFDEIIRKAADKGIHTGWSNPCLEIWMYAYFGSMPVIQHSRTCCDRFGEIYKKKTGHEYSKSDDRLYERLTGFGDEQRAIKIAAQKFDQHKRNGNAKPSDMYPCSTIYELIKEIREKIPYKK